MNIKNVIVNPIEWDDISWTNKEESIDCGCDLLALICSFYRAGKKARTIYEKVERMHESGVFSKEYEQCDVVKAEQIRKFYRQKIIVKSLAATELSGFEKIVEWIVSNSSNLYKHTHLRPLIKLPVFYDEDTKTRDIIKNHITAKENTEITLDCELQFVDSVKKDVSRGIYISWYYATPENNLVKITTRLDKDDTSYGLWKAISRKQKTIKLKSEVVAKRLPGELFCAYELKDAIKFDIDFT